MFQFHRRVSIINIIISTITIVSAVIIVCICSRGLPFQIHKGFECPHDHLQLV